MAITTSPGLQFHPLLAAIEQPITYENRDAILQDSTGSVIFKQEDVRVPTGWSQTATNIVASKYLHGRLGSPERETGVDQLVDRVVSTIVRWGTEDGYFDETADA